MNSAAYIKRASRGQALIPVIFIVLILTALVVACASTARREIREAQAFCAQTQRDYAARGAAIYAMSALAQTSAKGSTYGTIPQSGSSDAQGWMKIGDVEVKVEAVDAASRLNINTADAQTLASLPALGAQPDLVAAIQDWRSSGEQGAPNGAKSDYYQSLTTPYNCKDAPFDTVDELLLVKGMTPSLLYGKAGGGQSAANADFNDIFSASTLPLADLLTAAGYESNLTADGAVRPNLNTANESDLTTAGLTSAQAQAVIAYRTSQVVGGAGTSTGGASHRSRAGGRQTGLGLGSGGHGSPGGLGTGGHGSPGGLGSGGSGTELGSGGSGSGGQTPGGGQGSTGAGSGSGTGAGSGSGAGAAAPSPFKSVADLLKVTGISRDDAAAIADFVSASGAGKLYGRINVNTAPQEVLACVPGMDRPTLDALTAGRQQKQVIASWGDLIRLTSITPEQLEAVAPYLCVKSSVYLLHIRALTTGQKGLYAATALVEIGPAGPKLLLWRETPRETGWSNWQPFPVLPDHR